MLEFESFKAKGKVVFNRGEIRVAEIMLQPDFTWSFGWFNNHEILSSDEMRQIADKLDKLNHVS